MFLPAAAQWLRHRRVAALAASTHLVGMIFPGLHQFDYSNLALHRLRHADVEEFPELSRVWMRIRGFRTTGP